MLAAATLPAATARMTVARPGNRVSAGKDIIRPGHRAGEVDLDGPAAGGDAHCLKGLGCNGLTDGHDYIVAGNAELLLLGLGGRGATIRP